MTSSHRLWGPESSECDGEGERESEARKEMHPWGPEEGGSHLWGLKGQGPKHVPGLGAVNLLSRDSSPPEVLGEPV